MKTTKSQATRSKSASTGLRSSSRRLIRFRIVRRIWIEKPRDRRMGEGVATHRPFKIIALFPDDEAQTAPAGELRRRSAATSQVAPGILPAASRVFFVYLGFEK